MATFLDHGDMLEVLVLSGWLIEPFPWPINQIFQRYMDKDDGWPHIRPIKVDGGSIFGVYL